MPRARSVKNDSFPRVLGSVAVGSALLLVACAKVAFRDGYDTRIDPTELPELSLMRAEQTQPPTTITADPSQHYVKAPVPRRAHAESKLGDPEEPQEGEGEGGEEESENQDDNGCQSGYRSTLITHVLAIGIDSENDLKNTEYIKEWMGRENCMDQEGLANYLEISPGINAYNWPEKFDEAEKAVSGLESRLGTKDESEGGAHSLGELYYAGAVAEARANNNTLPEGWMHIAHHVGCMYGHMFQWQRQWDEQWDDVVVLESDAPWTISVPAYSFQDIVKHQPSDYDIMFLTHGPAVSGDYMYSFKSQGPKESADLHIYRWNQMQGAAGLQGYVSQKRMKDKLDAFIVKTGGMDMVDAWLMVKVCSSIQEDTQTYALNCYHVSPNAPEGVQLNFKDPDVAWGDQGYVKVPRYEKNSYSDKWPYDLLGEGGEEDAGELGKKRSSKHLLEPFMGELGIENLDDELAAVEEVVEEVEEPEGEEVVEELIENPEDEAAYEASAEAPGPAEAQKVEAEEVVVEEVSEVEEILPVEGPEETESDTTEISVNGATSEITVDLNADIAGDVDEELEIDQDDTDAYEESFEDTVEAVAQAPEMSPEYFEEQDNQYDPEAIVDAIDDAIENGEYEAYEAAPGPEAAR